jgi:hypothetical protein
MFIFLTKFKVRITLLLSIGLVFSTPLLLNAQENSGAFIMTSVGLFKNFSNNSMPIIFSSNSTCINIQNGAAVLTGERGNGMFVVNCEVIANINSLGIKLFPNPVSDFPTIKFIKTPPLNDEFLVTIVGINGNKITNLRATGYELFQGKQINLSNIGTGTFFLQIESPKYIDALKFIKAK